MRDTRDVKNELELCYRFTDYNKFKACWINVKDFDFAKARKTNRNLCMFDEVHTTYTLPQLIYQMYKAVNKHYSGLDKMDIVLRNSEEEGRELVISNAEIPAYLARRFD